MPKTKERTMRRLNLSDAGAKVKLNISPDDIPTLVPDSVMAEWLDGVDEPFYKLQMIEYPIVANRITYEESFFESFVNKTKERPIPGSKSGHSLMWGERPATDLLMVGGKLEKNGDGTGRVYFKNYIPPSGESGDNTVFIRENRSDMVHYSLVAYTKEVIENDEDGRINVKVIESLGGERNDAVEYGVGAMKQVTNKTGDVITDENFYEGEETMDKQEVLKRLNAMRSNGDITLPEIAEALGLTEQVVSDKHRNAVKVVDALGELGIKNPVEDVTRMKNALEANAEAVRNAKITEAFGAPDPDADGSEKNLLRAYAAERVGNASGDELTKRINEIRESDPVAKQLAQDRADHTSDANNLGRVENRGDNTKTEDGPTVVDY